MSPLIRYLSQSALQELQLTTYDIIASIEHLLWAKTQQQAWNAPDRKSVV